MLPSLLPLLLCPNHLWCIGILPDMLGRGLLGLGSLRLFLCLSLRCLDLLSSLGPFQGICSLLLALGLIGPDGLLGLGGPQ